MHAPLLFYRRLVVVGLLWAILIGIASASGLLDLWYRQTAPEFLRTFPAQWAQFRTVARWNPFLQADRLTSWWLGEPSWYTIYITTSPTISVRLPAPLPPGPVQHPGSVLGGWLLSPSPLQYVPDPAARAARQAETAALATMLQSYWWATQRGGLLVVAMLIVGGGCLRCAQRWQQRSHRSRGQETASLSLTDTMFAERSCLIDVPQRRAWHLPLARLVDQALPGSRTARTMLRMLAAHATWPASLHHHGAAPGGLLPHTMNVFQHAMAHPGAQDADLGPAFLLAALAHDLGKLQTYTPDGHGGFVQTAGFHPNRSADLLLSIPTFQDEVPAPLRMILITALRCSAGRALTPVPPNAPHRVQEFMTWLAEVDRAAVRADVHDLAARLQAIAITGCVEQLLQAAAPAAELLAPVYRDPHTAQSYLVRTSARVVWLTLLGLADHPGAHASVGRRGDPVWEHLLQSLRAYGLPLGEELSVVMPDSGMRVRMVPIAPPGEPVSADDGGAHVNGTPIHTGSEDPE